MDPLSETPSKRPAPSPVIVTVTGYCAEPLDVLGSSPTAETMPKYSVPSSEVSSTCCPVATLAMSVSPTEMSMVHEFVLTRVNAVLVDVLDVDVLLDEELPPGAEPPDADDELDELDEPDPLTLSPTATPTLVIRPSAGATRFASDIAASAVSTFACATSTAADAAAMRVSDDPASSASASVDFASASAAWGSSRAACSSNVLTVGR